MSDEHSLPHYTVVNPLGYFYPLKVALKVEWCKCYFVICCSLITKGTPSLNMNGHQKTFGKRSTPVSFLTHQMNHSPTSNRLVIKFGKRKSSIIFLEFCYFLGKKPEKKTFLFKNVWFSSAFQEFTYYKLKLTEQEMCFIS